MSYRVEIFREAEKTLETLDKVMDQRIRKKLRELAQAPLDPRLSKQMETAKDRRYSRVGDWRIIYRVNEASGTLDIIAIRPRSRAYR
uniref:Type II toxin-antitoxin system RelE/ParE family toxin n=1 Tax=Desulfobacca acetoxidans TaxID=60893 RepID=A0A7V6A4G9_9BACT